MSISHEVLPPIFFQGEAPNFATREFVTNRRALEAALFKAIRERLGGICCAVDCTQYEFGMTTSQQHVLFLV